MPSIGPLELVIVLVIVLLIFGPKRLPGLGRQIGTGMREFKDSVSGDHNDHKDEMAAPEHEIGRSPSPEPEVLPEPREHDKVV